MVAAAGEEAMVGVGVAEEVLSDDMETGAPKSSSSSSGSSSSLARCSSLSRFSFDCSPSPSPAAVAAAACSPRPVSRPHRAGEVAWAAIRAATSSAASPAASLGPRDFRLVKRVGGGDVGTVYLCRLRAGSAAARESPCLYAMKVVDRRAVARKHKLERAAAEKRVLRRLDHPFLPTLFADFDATPHFSCVVMEFCPGGDLHSLRHRMPSRRFPLPSAQFYAAEVLLALEYLHMMGIVYRDLKPENVLIRADGHIMLTDFDLSLECTSSPSLEPPPTAAEDDDDYDDDSSAASATSCFPRHLLGGRFKRQQQQQRRPRPGSASASAQKPPRFVAEPVTARSCSFVGTHEYVAPEVAAGGPHGAAVDWWALGVFLYELLHGRTPFAGATNEETLRNIVRAPLAFPSSNSDDNAAAKDLIARLLTKDPATRLGSRRGAADVKAHPFFRPLNLALLRSSRPPVIPGTTTTTTTSSSLLHRSQSCSAATPKPRPDPRFDLF